MAGILGREVISTRQRKIAELAQREPKWTLTTLAHHIDEGWMREAYRRIRKDAAAGVDGVTAVQYETDLEANLSGLLERFKSGRYRAPAVRRVHLEKPGTSKTRPIGIPTLEDKILQRAVLMAMGPVYEQDFLDCSYGFRPRRSFAMLGFTHHWGRSRKGRWVVKRKTAKDRLSRALRGIGQWWRRHRHQSRPEQHAALSRRLRGHYAYYGITGNFPARARLLYEVYRRWRKWLGRRSRRARLSWDRFSRLLNTYPLPPVRIVHSMYR